MGYHRCVYGGHVSAVQNFLTEKRTNINLIVYQEDGSYITALDIALKIGDMGAELVTLLRDQGGLTYQELLVQYESHDSIPGIPPPPVSEKKDDVNGNTKKKGQKKNKLADI